MIATAQSVPAHLGFVDWFGPWLSLACFVILFLAAFLHWRRTRHWCLLALAIGSFLAALSNLATRITLGILLIGRWHDYGAMMFVTGLLRIWPWFAVAGAAIAAVGGIGAVRWAIRLTQRAGGTP